MGHKMVPVEMGEPGGTVEHCTKGAPSNSTGRFTVGEGVGGRMVLCHCDNRAVVDVVNCGYSRDRDMMHPLHSLFLYLRTSSLLGRGSALTRKEEYCSRWPVA